MPAIRPRYADLTGRADYPDGSSWGLWGDDDSVGALNDVYASDIRDAAALVRDGKVSSLNWRLDQPNPGLFGRKVYRHIVHTNPWGMDDELDMVWPQASSQWDSLAHFRHPLHGFYNGRSADNRTELARRNGIHHWARRGIAARFVLADVGRWRTSIGKPLDFGTSEAVPCDELQATLRAQNVTLRRGDVLLLRFGWIAWYESTTAARRAAIAQSGPAAPGLAGDHATVAWLWDSGVCAVAGDNPALEAHPFDPGGPSLHADLLALLGIPLGELWNLDALANDCHDTGRFDGLLTSAPLHIPGGIGSPANALALK